MCLQKYKDDPRVHSILFVGYPGQSGGQGLSDVLFGDYSPSGRLTQTFYSHAFVDEVSFYDMNMRPTAANPGRGYRFYSGDHVVYPFGFGLSYANFEYQWVSPMSTGEPPLFTISVKVINNGGFSSSAADSVLVYLEPPSNAGVTGSPKRYLRKFEKVNLEPNSHQTLIFHFDRDDFTLVDYSGVSTLVRGDWGVRIGDLYRTVNV